MNETGVIPTYGHTGSHVEDLTIRCDKSVLSSGKRATHYGLCRCGWTSKRRTSAQTVLRDYYAHLADTDDPNAR